MTTTIPTPSLSFSPASLAPSSNDAAALPAPSPAANDVRPAARPDFTQYGRILSDPRVRSFLLERLGDVNMQKSDKQDLVDGVLEVAGKIGLTDDDVEVMYAVTWDSEASYEELAAERKTTASALRSRVHRLQQALKKGWDRRLKRSLILTLILLAMLLLFVLSALGVGRNPPPPAPLPEPTVHEVAPVAPTAATAKPPPGPGLKPGAVLHP